MSDLEFLDKLIEVAPPDTTKFHLDDENFGVIIVDAKTFEELKHE